MDNSVKNSMLWLHTWLSLSIGIILMIAFFFGSLSVFDREIDRWAIPETRFEPQPMPSFDNLLQDVLKTVEPNEDDYAATMPTIHDFSAGEMTPRLDLKPVEYWAYTTHRDPVLAAGVGYGIPHAKDPDGHNHIHGWISMDPRTGEIIPDSQLAIGSDFFFPLHYGLTFSWYNVGYWLIGIAGMVMMVGLVTGVIIHRKIFAEFFTFRPNKKIQRSTLDLHNMSGVVGLPFHFFFAFTGLLIFASWLYFPASDTVLKPMHLQHDVEESQQTGLPLKPAGIPAEMSSVDAMMAKAQQRWSENGMPGDIGYLTIAHLGDKNAYVSVYRASTDRVGMTGYGVHFSATTGEIIMEDPAFSPINAVSDFLISLHFQHFEHWLLRWLYVIGGLLGCVCIATGFIFYVEKRKLKHASNGSQGSRIVDAIGVTSVTGMLIATLAMLVANRIIPSEYAGKGDLEINIFWGLWMIALVHALIRSKPVLKGLTNPAWQEQCWVICAFGVTAVALNWISTGDHLAFTLANYLPVAGVDICLLVTSAIAFIAARKLSRQPATEKAKSQTYAKKVAHG
ncbi:MAG: PepSY-associated TM helix domain-containing protein [Pseudomonadota bacterium]